MKEIVLYSMQERASGKPAATSEQYLPLKPSVKVPTSMTHPCEQTSLDAQQPNETETNRYNIDISFCEVPTQSFKNLLYYTLQQSYITRFTGINFPIYLILLGQKQINLQIAVRVCSLAFVS